MRTVAVGAGSAGVATRDRRFMYVNECVYKKNIKIYIQIHIYAKICKYEYNPNSCCRRT